MKLVNKNTTVHLVATIPITILTDELDVEININTNDVYRKSKIFIFDLISAFFLFIYPKYIFKMVSLNYNSTVGHSLRCGIIENTYVLLVLTTASWLS